jgi:hypothetical protein
VREDYVRRERNEFRRVSADTIGITSAPAGVDPHVAPHDPTQLLKALAERRYAGLCFRIVRSHEHADAPHPIELLRARTERPGDRRAAKQ